MNKTLEQQAQDAKDDYIHAEKMGCLWFNRALEAKNRYQNLILQLTLPITDHKKPE